MPAFLNRMRSTRKLSPRKMRISALYPLFAFLLKVINFRFIGRCILLLAAQISRLKFSKSVNTVKSCNLFCESFRTRGETKLKDGDVIYSIDQKYRHL